MIGEKKHIEKKKKKKKKKARTKRSFPKGVGFSALLLFCISSV